MNIEKLKKFDSLINPNKHPCYLTVLKNKHPKNGWHLLTLEEAIVAINNKEFLAVVLPKKNVGIDLDIPKKDVLKKAGLNKKDLKDKLLRFAKENDYFGKTIVVETENGLHLYFKETVKIKQCQGELTTFGINLDVREAEKGYLILPFNDSNRRFLSLENLTDYLQIFNKTGISFNKSVLNWIWTSEGDRNNAFFEHTRQLKYFCKFTQIETETSLQIFYNYFLENKKNMNFNEVKSTINSVYKNKNNYEGITSPLTINQEMKKTDTIVEEKKTKNEIIGWEIAEIVKEDINVHYYFFGNNCYFYNKGIYEDDIEYKKILNYLTKNLPLSYKKKHLTDEIIYWLSKQETQNYEEFFLEFDDFIAFNNCIYNIKKHEILEFNPNYFLINKIPFDLEKKEIELIDLKLYNVLKNKMLLLEEDILMLLYFILYCLSNKNDLKKMLWLVGKSGTGKTMLLNLITKIISSKYVSNFSIQDLKTSDKFNLAELKDKKVNIVGDDSAESLTDVTTLKKITGGDTINACRKYMSPFNFNVTTKLISSFNTLPTILNDKSGAFEKRLLILEINIELENLNRNYFNDLYKKEEIEKLLSYLIFNLKYSNLNFELNTSKKSQELTKNVSLDSNNVALFSHFRIIKIDNSSILIEKLYSSYQDFCYKYKKNGFGRNNFIKELERLGYIKKRILDKKTNTKKSYFLNIKLTEEKEE